MPMHFQFNTFIGTLCVARDTDVHKLGPKLDIDPTELLKMINGHVPPNQVDRDRAGGGGVGLRPGLPAEARRRNQIVNFRPQNRKGKSLSAPPLFPGVVSS
jgi:hypothetical protein